MTNNPLMEFARKTELYVRLPSKQNWYTPDIVTFTMSGEIEVKPMTPKDELMMINPDALLSGEANIKLIESCCPSVHKAGELLYPDANVLLLAIRRATYGQTLDMPNICPKCYEKTLNKTQEEIAKMEKENLVCLRPQDYEFNLDNILSAITYLENEYIYETPDGLKIYIRPNLLRNKLEYGLLQFHQQKIMNMYKDYDFEKFQFDEEKKKILKIIQDVYQDMTDTGNKLVASSIIKIVLPDGSFVDNYEMILEFIANTNSNIVSDLHNEIKKLNDIGLIKELEFECECCGHQWTDRFYGYNQVDFFGISS